MNRRKFMRFALASAAAAIAPVAGAQVKYYNGADDGRLTYQVIGTPEQVDLTLSRKLPYQHEVTFDEAVRHHLFKGWRVFYQVDVPRFTLGWSENTRVVEVLGAITKRIPVYITIDTNKKTVEIARIDRTMRL